MQSTRSGLVVAALCCVASTASAASTGTDSGSIVVYVGIGIIVLLFVAAAFLVWRCRRNRKRRRATTLRFAPESTSNAFRLEIGEGHDAQVGQRHEQSQQQQQQQQHPVRKSKKHDQAPVVPATNGLEANGLAHLESVELDAFQDAKSDDDLEPADLYFPLGPGAGPVSDYIGPAAEPAAYEQRPSQHSQERYQQHHRHGSYSAAARDFGHHGRHHGTHAGKAATPAEPLHHILEELAIEPALQGHRVDYSAIYYIRVLSKGSFGEVWLGQIETRQVAIKRILKEKKDDEKEIECFASEIKLMASFSHPKIVEFVGVSWTNIADLCAITEYMAKGDLYGFLKQHIGRLNWRDHKIFLAEDVADAIGYLHSLSPKVIHRDLKSKNILLDDAFRAKLSDFGISRERSVEDTMTAGVGTIYWTAPEVLMGKKYTEKADIYSFGIVMSELDTHQVPYSDKRDDSGKKLQGMKIVQTVIKHNMRPTLSSNIPWQVSDLIDRCVDSDPDVRPSATELLRQIRLIADELD